MPLIARALDDPNLIARVICHPRIWPSVSDDGSGAPEDFRVSISDSIIYLGMYDSDEFIGLFMLHAHNAICWEVHTCLLPIAWGDKAKECATLCIRWMFSNTGCSRLITNVPLKNKLALRLAQAAGMQQFGINEKSFLKDGILFDQIMLGISKE